MYPQQGGIIWKNHQIVGATHGSPERIQEGEACLAPTDKQPTLGNIIGSFKSEITKQIRIITNNPKLNVWQRNYWEHIIRNETELLKIQQYIQLNPQIWERDRNNIENL